MRENRGRRPFQRKWITSRATLALTCLSPERHMRSKMICFLAVTMLGLNSPSAAHAQSTPSSSSPRSGPRAEFLQEISYYEERYTRLAEAVPADKYNWRPAEGVRSIGEVYAHIAAANYGIARALGAQP